MHSDDEPGSGEKRAASEGRENRGGQAGQGKHRMDVDDSANAGGGQRRKKASKGQARRTRKGEGSGRR